MGRMLGLAKPLRCMFFAPRETFRVQTALRTFGSRRVQAVSRLQSTVRVVLDLLHGTPARTRLILPLSRTEFFSDGIM